MHIAVIGSAHNSIATFALSADIGVGEIPNNIHPGIVKFVGDITFEVAVDLGNGFLQIGLENLERR